MEKQKIIAFIDVDFNRYWSRSVLGKVFDIVIDNIAMKIHFPGLPLEWNNKSKKDALNYPLSSPKISSKYKLGEEDIFYGLPCSYPSCSSLIEKIVISFEIEENELKNKSHLIYESIEKTIKKLHKLCYIVNQDLKPLSKVEKNGYNVYLYNESLGERIRNNKNIELIAHLHEDSNSISSKQLITILDIINKEIDIPIEYDFFISGVKAYENHDNRKCVFDLSTACEIAITSKIEEIQKTLNIGNFLDKFRMLTEEYKLLGLLNYDISFADISIVTEARNKAIHKGKEVTDKQAIEAIKVTRTILNKLSKFY